MLRSPQEGSPAAAPVTARVLSVNIGTARASEHTDADGGMTGIGKRPVNGPVAVTAPGPKGTGGSGLAGDFIGDLRHHGGDEQAVYAYAREDLDRWQRELGRELPGGVFGENLTTQGIDVSEVRIGERWRIGPDLVLQAASPRIPCRTFAGWLQEQAWVKRFTRAAAPGAYFRVIEPGEIRAGDRIEVLHRPDHEVSVAFFFRARTTEPELRPRLMAAGDALSGEELDYARRWAADPS
ncbi:MOSC domain-containing protein [Streptomyces aidingensis]|uniref:MOSC domain-containing protein YiiM n=1 Tax=Streptomyces aidingensis TaxID=910347 RepID=A0A1I1GNM6_9ACTN|nr:MOSC domain-containing protein [Streptomyces aidingensis]SFC12892.1 MOSC domain-containing protein YiiM [Streptomyces aidingensis]